MVHLDATFSAGLQNALLLVEPPNDAIADPQDVPGTIHETTGDRDVRIGRRGQARMNLCPGSRARSRPRWPSRATARTTCATLRGCAQGCGIAALMTGLLGTEERHRSRIRGGKGIQLKRGCARTRLLCGGGCCARRTSRSEVRRTNAVRWQLRLDYRWLVWVASLVVLACFPNSSGAPHPDEASPAAGPTRIPAVPTSPLRASIADTPTAPQPMVGPESVSAHAKTVRPAVRPPGTIFALLADGRLLALRADGSTAMEPLAPPPPGSGRSTGHLMALSHDAQRLYVLVPGDTQQASSLTVIDATTTRILAQRALGELGVYRALAIGPLTGRLYVFGNRGETEPQPGQDPLAPRQVSVVIAQLDPDTGAVLAEWLPRQADGYDWRVYQGAVSADERRLYVSYHGSNTTGIDWFDVAADGLHRCPASQRPNFGCIGAHGGFMLHDDKLLAATGSTVILEADHTGAAERAIDTQLQGNHLMEFVVHARDDSLYAVGSCGYTGGFSAVSLRRTGVPTTPTAPGEWAWDATPGPPRTFRRSGVCGERLALSSDGATLVVGKTQMPVPRAGRPGELLLVDTATGDVLDTIATPSEPADVLVLETGGS
jgi:hypothetical protein